MARYSDAQRRTRIGFDYLSCTEIARRSDLLSLEAYASTRDLRARNGAIADPADGHRAVHYLATYHPLKTLCGPGRFMDTTSIHIDVLANGNYPFSPPASWVTTQMPWSPHFKQGTVVCIGDLWDKRGTTLLAHLIRHHARLLNWDERARGGGYVGWNGEAIAWHASNYQGQPLTPGLVYPELPPEVVYGVEAEPTFRPGRRSNARAVAAPVDAQLFGGRGRRRR
jgi:hypothetical protein